MVRSQGFIFLSRPGQGLAGEWAGVREALPDLLWWSGNCPPPFTNRRLLSEPRPWLFDGFVNGNFLGSRRTVN
jgi:hypothetical protein